MAQDQPIPRQDSEGTAVGDGDGAKPRPRRGRRLVTRFTSDRRLPLVLAGLGGAAGLASLIGEWVVLALPTGGPAGGALQVSETVSQVGSFGVAYLVGLLGLAVAVVLALRGTDAVRPNARIAGLALAAALLAVLLATVAAIGDGDPRAVYYGGHEGFDIEYGRGVVAAFLACVLLGTALLLAPATNAPAPAPESSEPPRARRRRSRRDDPNDDLPPPADLTVSPAAPFVRPDSPG